jgi:hypothetical protein
MRNEGHSEPMLSWKPREILFYEMPPPRRVGGFAPPPAHKTLYAKGLPGRRLCTHTEYVHTHCHSRTQTHTYTHNTHNTHTHTRTHSCRHAPTHTQTHKHTHTETCTKNWSLSNPPRIRLWREREEVGGRGGGEKRQDKGKENSDVRKPVSQMSFLGDLCQESFTFAKCCSTKPSF